MMRYTVAAIYSQLSPSCSAYHDSQFLFLLSLMWCAASNYHFDKEATERIIKQEMVNVWHFSFKMPK